MTRSPVVHGRVPHGPAVRDAVETGVFRGR
jgi:hypothetical protein